MLESVQFVVTADGRPTAVQMNIGAWRVLLDWLEDVEDQATVRDFLPGLCEGPHDCS